MKIDLLSLRRNVRYTKSLNLVNANVFKLIVYMMYN